MEKEVLIEVKGLSKKFSRSLKKGMWYGLREIVNTMFGLKGKKSVLRKGEFWSVKDINFELRRGECLALIGHNGAGKSTLLKMLNGLISPDEGSITMRGKVGALIELGAGFNPILTGRENIYVNGQLLGFTKKEIDSRLNSILEFAEIGDFIDSPIQNYSSGMKVRLGFAIAAQMEPDVLIIDEVLAVGDLGFVLKCFNTIDKLLENSAVIFVSHSMPQVSRICSSIIYMEKGRAVFQGNETSKGIDLYYSSFGNRVDKNIVFDRDQDVKFDGILLGAETGYVKDLFQVNRLENLDVRIMLQVRQSIKQFYVSLSVFDKEQRSIGVCQMDKPVADKIIKTESGYNFYEVKLTLPRINLSKGLYSFSIALSEENSKKPLLRVQGIKNFQVFSENDIWPPIEFEGIWS